MSKQILDIPTINQRIALVRKDNKLTQKEFSLALGVSRSYISEVEHGKCKPSIEMLIGINNHFDDINPDWLLTGKGTMYRRDANQPPEWLNDWWQQADDEHLAWLKIQLSHTPPTTKTHNTHKKH